MTIGKGEQLLLDDAILRRRHGARRRVIPACKVREPVLEPDRPWENGMAVFGTVLRDGGLFRMWYLGGGHVCYAESHDGRRWKKPDLEEVELEGRRTNIVVPRGGFGKYYELFGVVKDERDSDPARRYKMAYLSIDRAYNGPHGAPFHPGQRRGLSTAVSPDGIHWTPETEFASDHVCDISRFFQHPESGRFVVYGRTRLSAHRDHWRSWGWGRAVTRIESDDFRTWSAPQFTLGADAQDPEGTEIYSMPAFEYHGLRIAMVQMFYGGRDQGNLEIQLASSRDGITFQRLEDRRPFLPEGPVGTWDRFNISLGCLPPVAVGDEWWFYYSGRTHRHKPYEGPDNGPSCGRMGLATCPRGRLAALEASFDGGVVETVPVTEPARRLYLNANARWGQVEVSLVDADEARPVSPPALVQGEDGVDIPVPVPAESLTRPTALRLKLTNAQVYGFRMD